MKLRILTGMLVVLLACSATVRGGMVPDMLVASRQTNQVLRYDGDTGEFVGVFAEGNGLSFPDHMLFGPDNNLYVGGGSKVLRFDGQTGGFIDQFTSGLAANSAGMRFGPNGDLYVARIPSLGGGGVVRIDGATGENLGYLISFPGSNYDPTDLDFGPDGNLYLALNGEVLRYDPETGELIDPFIPYPVINDLIDFGSDGYFYGAIRSLDVAWQYDGETGELLNEYLHPELDGVGGFTIGPDGLFYLSSSHTDSVVRFDPQTAEFIDTFALGGGLGFPRDVLFVPEPDCLACLFVGLPLLGRRRRARRF